MLLNTSAPAFVPVSSSNTEVEPPSRATLEFAARSPSTRTSPVVGRRIAPFSPLSAKKTVAEISSGQSSQHDQRSWATIVSTSHASSPRSRGRGRGLLSSRSLKPPGDRSPLYDRRSPEGRRTRLADGVKVYITNVDKTMSAEDVSNLALDYCRKLKIYRYPDVQVDNLIPGKSELNRSRLSNDKEKELTLSFCNYEDAVKFRREVDEKKFGYRKVHVRFEEERDQELKLLKTTTKYDTIIVSPVSMKMRNRNNLSVSRQELDDYYYSDDIGEPRFPDGGMIAPAQFSFVHSTPTKVKPRETLAEISTRHIQQYQVKGASLFEEEMSILPQDMPVIYYDAAQNPEPIVKRNRMLSAPNAERHQFTLSDDSFRLARNSVRSDDELTIGPHDISFVQPKRQKKYNFLVPWWDGAEYLATPQEKFLFQLCSMSYDGSGEGISPCIMAELDSVHIWLHKTFKAMKLNMDEYSSTLVPLDVITNHLRQSLVANPLTMQYDTVPGDIAEIFNPDGSKTKMFIHPKGVPFEYFLHWPDANNNTRSSYQIHYFDGKKMIGRRRALLGTKLQHSKRPPAHSLFNKLSQDHPALMQLDTKEFENGMAIYVFRALMSERHRGYVTALSMFIEKWFGREGGAKLLNCNYSNSNAHVQYWTKSVELLVDSDYIVLLGTGSDLYVAPSPRLQIARCRYIALHTVNQNDRVLDFTDFHRKLIDVFKYNPDELEQVISMCRSFGLTDYMDFITQLFVPNGFLKKTFVRHENGLEKADSKIVPEFYHRYCEAGTIPKDVIQLLLDGQLTAIDPSFRSLYRFGMVPHREVKVDPPNAKFSEQSEWREWWSVEYTEWFISTHKREDCQQSPLFAALLTAAVATYLDRKNGPSPYFDEVEKRMKELFPPSDADIENRYPKTAGDMSDEKKRKTGGETFLYGVDPIVLMRPWYQQSTVFYHKSGEDEAQPMEGSVHPSVSPVIPEMQPYHTYHHPGHQQGAGNEYPTSIISDFFWPEDESVGRLCFKTDTTELVGDLLNFLADQSTVPYMIPRKQLYSNWNPGWKCNHSQDLHSDGLSCKLFTCFKNVNIEKTPLACLLAFVPIVEEEQVVNLRLRLHVLGENLQQQEQTLVVVRPEIQRAWRGKIHHDITKLTCIDSTQLALFYDIKVSNTVISRASSHDKIHSTSSQSAKYTLRRQLPVQQPTFTMPSVYVPQHAQKVTWSLGGYVNPVDLSTNTEFGVTQHAVYDPAAILHYKARALQAQVHARSQSYPTFMQ